MEQRSEQDASMKQTTPSEYKQGEQGSMNSRVEQKHPEVKDVNPETGTPEKKSERPPPEMERSGAAKEDKPIQHPQEEAKAEQQRAPPSDNPIIYQDPNKDNRSFPEKIVDVVYNAHHAISHAVTGLGETPADDALQKDPNLKDERDHIIVRTSGGGSGNESSQSTGGAEDPVKMKNIEKTYQAQG